MIMARARSEDLQRLKELIEAGKVTPVIDGTYPLSGVPDAIRDLHRARGKVCHHHVSRAAALQLSPNGQRDDLILDRVSHASSATTPRNLS
jgi:hypothetical protein